LTDDLSNNLYIYLLNVRIKFRLLTSQQVSKDSKGKKIINRKSELIVLNHIKVEVLNF